MAVMTTGIEAEDRVAPGQLRLVQEFLNTLATEPTEEELRMAQAIRRARKGGASQSALAARYGVSQQLVSAILRGKRLLAPSSGVASDSAATTLGSVQSARQWLVSRGFLEPGDALSPQARARILKLQSVLLALALANSGEPLPPAVPSTLQRLAAKAPLIVTLRGQGSPTLAPDRRGADAFIGTLLAVVYDAMRDGRWTRLKACPADRCHHVFYDTSRNRTSTWCSMSICGNRTKVRKYQQRRRVARTQ
jgi:transcriptional regulator with XRE-family HTH domain